MDTILEMRIGPFGVLALTIVTGLVAIDIRWTFRTHRRLLTQMPEPPVAYHFALAYGVWYHTVLIAIAGVATLYGWGIAFILFAAGIVWRAVGPVREAVANYLGGDRTSDPKTQWLIASAYGIAWFGTTRGIPLALLYVSMHAV